MNLTNTRNNWDKTHNNQKTSNEEFNNSLLKILDLEKNFMVHNRILDSQHNNNKNFSMNLTRLKKNSLKIMQSQKLTDLKYKNC